MGKLIAAAGLLAVVAAVAGKQAPELRNRDALTAQLRQRQQLQ